MSDLQHDPYGERRRYLNDNGGGGSWAIGALMALFLVFGLIFAFSSRTDSEQQASNMERRTPTTMTPQAPRAPASTTGSGASTTGSGSSQ